MGVAGLRDGRTRSMSARVLRAGLQRRGHTHTRPLLLGARSVPALATVTQAFRPAALRFGFCRSQWPRGVSPLAPHRPRTPLGCLGLPSRLGVACPVSDRGLCRSAKSRGPGLGAVRGTSRGTEGKRVCMAGGGLNRHAGHSRPHPPTAPMALFTVQARGGGKCRQVVKRPQGEQDPRGHCWGCPASFTPAELGRVRGTLHGEIELYHREAEGGHRQQARCVEVTSALCPCGWLPRGTW